MNNNFIVEKRNNFTEKVIEYSTHKNYIFKTPIGDIEIYKISYDTPNIYCININKIFVFSNTSKKDISIYLNKLILRKEAKLKTYYNILF